MTASFWDELPWELCDPPLRPMPSELERFRAFAAGFDHGVLLGATPSIAEAVPNVLPLDLAPGRVAQCPRALVADWRLLAHPGVRCPFVIGDGILGSIDGTDAHSLVRSLKGNGIAGLVRCYTRDDPELSPTGHNAAKLSAWALAADSSGTFTCDAAWHVAKARGWLDLPNAARAFGPYVGQHGRLWLASVAELQELGDVTPAVHKGCVWLRW